MIAHCDVVGWWRVRRLDEPKMPSPCGVVNIKILYHEKIFELAVSPALPAARRSQRRLWWPGVSGTLIGSMPPEAHREASGEPGRYGVAWIGANMKKAPQR